MWKLGKFQGGGWESNIVHEDRQNAKSDAPQRFLGLLTGQNFRRSERRPPTHRGDDDPRVREEDTIYARGTIIAPDLNINPHLICGFLVYLRTFQRGSQFIGLLSSTH